ncbi:60S ribosomal protein L30-like [Drosophila obscura]|uniref:60S ribosomal protein L30-like n=1 Tax=Drosophila obscura TaxID=7282 RepID=UPI001BB0D92D|nr:60S ribosomal protein L30-like [Drosophila obscura]
MNYLSACLEVALEDGKYIVGYKQSLKALRGGKAKLVILASNIPNDMKSQVEKYATETQTQLMCFSGTNFDLGNAIGKYFNVGTMVITDAKVSQDVLRLLADTNE